MTFKMLEEIRVFFMQPVSIFIKTGWGSQCSSHAAKWLNSWNDSRH